MRRSRAITGGEREIVSTLVANASFNGRLVEFDYYFFPAHFACLQ